MVLYVPCPDIIQIFSLNASSRNSRNFNSLHHSEQQFMTCSHFNSAIRIAIYTNVVDSRIDLFDQSLDALKQFLICLLQVHVSKFSII